MWAVYILKCSDNTCYTGCTHDLNDRLKRRMKGQVAYTAPRLPVQVVHQSVFYDKYKAYHFEKYLKSGVGRVFAKNGFTHLAN